jgi:hypothetical protein
MRGTALMLAAVVTLGSTWLSMTAMAADRRTTERHVTSALAAKASPAPAGHLWYGGVLPAINVEAPAYAVLDQTPAPKWAPPRRRA